MRTKRDTKEFKIKAINKLSTKNIIHIKYCPEGHIKISPHHQNTNILPPNQSLVGLGKYHLY